MAFLDHLALPPLSVRPLPCQLKKRQPRNGGKNGNRCATTETKQFPSKLVLLLHVHGSGLSSFPRPSYEFGTVVNRQTESKRCRRQESPVYRRVIRLGMGSFEAGMNVRKGQGKFFHSFRSHYLSSVVQPLWRDLSEGNTYSLRAHSRFISIHRARHDDE